MKFPRNARILRGQLDAAPFASVFFLLVMVLLLPTLVYTPGVRIQLPASTTDLPGVAGLRVAVAVDKTGRFYYENENIQPRDLQARLAEQVRKANAPLTLVIQADREVTAEMLVRLESLARAAGITQALQQTLPPLFGSRPGTSRQP